MYGNKREEGMEEEQLTWPGISYYLLFNRGGINGKKQWNQQMGWNLYTEMYKRVPFFYDSSKGSYEVKFLNVCFLIVVLLVGVQELTYLCAVLHVCLK